MCSPATHSEPKCTTDDACCRPPQAVRRLERSWPDPDRLIQRSVAAQSGSSARRSRSEVAGLQMSCPLSNTPRTVGNNADNPIANSHRRIQYRENEYAALRVKYAASCCASTYFVAYGALLGWRCGRHISSVLVPRSVPDRCGRQSQQRQVQYNHSRFTPTRVYHCRA